MSWEMDWKEALGDIGAAAASGECKIRHDGRHMNNE